jgi:hypothetical protein
MRKNLAYGLFALIASNVWSCDDSARSVGKSAAVSGSGSAAMSDAATPGDTQPTAAGSSAPVSAARFPDACAERRGSWSKPCSADPNPCGIHSGYPGDEYCLVPPPPGQGIQIHFGPKDYNDAADVAQYVMLPGQEFNSYAIVNIPTTEQRYYSYVKISMRPGSHHLINNLLEGHRDEGFLPNRTGCDGTMLGSFPGTQNLIVESPPQGIPAPENEGLGNTLPGNASLCQNYHRYNNTDAPALSEIWYNLWFVDAQDITQRSDALVITAGPWRPIQPHTAEVLTALKTVEGDGRIISLFGHRHAATERFAVWLNDGLVYDSWDWVESRLFNYDSVTINPATDPAKKVDGATSGILDVKKGDQIKIECHVNNTTDQALSFKNELYTGEMCILFGSTVGVGIYMN